MSRNSRFIIIILLVAVIALPVVYFLAKQPVVPSSSGPRPTQTPSSSLHNPNLKTFSSPDLGISFTYLEKTDSQSFSVRQNDNKVYIYSTAAPYTQGQFVQVFPKPAAESLSAAVTRLFLTGKDPAKCFVTPYLSAHYSPDYQAAEINFPDDPEPDLPKMNLKTEYCSADYAKTNGIRYFLMDKNHPSKLLFFSIGQYGIMSDQNQPWQNTVSVTD